MAKTERNQKILAQTISLLLNPAVCILLLALVFILHFKISSGSIALIFSPFVLPILLYIILFVHVFKKIDLEFTSRKTRPPILVIACIGLVVASLFSTELAPLITPYLERFLLVLIFTTILTFVWKISFHAIFFTSMVFILVRIFGNEFLLLLLLLPPLYWSRMELRKHKLSQLILY